MSSETRQQAQSDNAIRLALAKAERHGFRWAVYGRTVAVLSFAVGYFWTLHSPSNYYVGGAALGIALLGPLSLMLVCTRFERIMRFCLFALDACLISAMLAFVPLTGGEEVPQNLVFYTSRVQFYYVVIAASVLALSPLLVLWTGLCCVVGLGCASAWIIHGMPKILSLGNLPPGPSRREYISTILNPDFLGIAYRAHEIMIILLVTGIVAFAVHKARHVVGARANWEARHHNVRKLFRRYVPEPVAKELISEGRLSSEMRKATLLFADIEGFTGIAEHMPPAELIRLLNGVFSEITKVVDRNGGIVVNHIGDAIIASFNAPLPIDDAETRAIATAQQLLAMVSSTLFEGRQLRLRIGIASGPVAAGAVGGDGRQTYTLYGDAVNLAQRLEALNKELGTSCLVCGTTFKNATDRTTLVSMGSMTVRNRQGPVQVYTLSTGSNP